MIAIIIIASYAYLMLSGETDLTVFLSSELGLFQLISLFIFCIVFFIMIFLGWALINFARVRRMGKEFGIVDTNSG